MLYDLDAWHDFFVAAAGAAGALAGLVFVAVSINITAILAARGVPERGLQTVLLLLTAVIVSLFGLAPQGHTAFAVEVLVCGALLLGWIGSTLGVVLSGSRGHPLWAWSRLVVVVPGSVPYLVAGVSMLTHAGGGLAWVLAGVVGAIMGAVINAWVLLVEILR